jgi:NAD(P)H-dependent flavin oxidoreductase YrpB (nitropropane dioxygenase family)
MLEFNKDDDLRYRYKMAYSISRSYHTIVSFTFDGFPFSVDKNLTYTSLEETYNNYKKMQDQQNDNSGIVVEVVNEQKSESEKKE